MNTEKEIINWWLNRKGFFTINSISAGRNKEIDILALKMANGITENIMHIEASCSISSVDNLTPEEYARKFEDKDVVRKIKKCISDFVGADKGYEKVLVLGLTSRMEDFRKLKGIIIFNFSDILCDVMDSLSRQNYRSDVIRTMQTVKYIFMAHPEKLAYLVEKQGDNQILNHSTREKFIKELLKQGEIKRIMDKESSEDVLVSLLKESSIKKPEKLAKILVEEILTNRSRKKFLKYLLENRDFKRLSQKIEKKKEKPLKYFFRQG